ncbi:HGL250Wp [Eremothecium sinecaudum]|uniref:FK506-binding protein n=1 Tax=Eremothecium sinecaudum TaxID=45286 RepID=A0A0X8HV71_9SACH|nr:HGL250Wp [Eremothecium sinecaudum]AMD22090.1 HGL250Wp [Eremothecium sinecaudum]
MSDLLPMATYSLNVEPYTPTPAIDVATPVTVRITLVAIDPESMDDEKKPSTLRIIRRNPNFDDEDDDILGDYNEEELEHSDEEDEDEEEEEEADAKDEDDDEGEDEDDDDEDEDEDEDEDDDEFEEFVLATLSPESQYQQTLDLVISPEEEVQFVVTGSYRVSLSGNYVKHPFDDPELYDDEEDDEDYYDEEDSEVDEEDLLDVEEASDVEAKIEELVEKDTAKKEKRKLAASAEESKSKKAKKEPVEQPKKEKKDKKKQKKEDSTEKKVEFKKDLEEGPSKKKETKGKPKTSVLEGGIVIEDRVTGSGKAAKKGSKVGMRYIGKLKNGKVFDKNTSGKPFVFKLGHGEVIKGWDIGVAGMSVGGERRIVIPAAYAYGNQALPGIPANSELTFDVKLVSMK